MQATIRIATGYNGQKLYPIIVEKQWLLEKLKSIYPNKIIQDGPARTKKEILEEAARIYWNKPFQRYEMWLHKAFAIMEREGLLEIYKIKTITKKHNTKHGIKFLTYQLKTYKLP